jgi:alpha-beta hydrolase superfamily lysophospholipase
MEEIVTIPSHDNKKIYCTFGYPKNKTDKIVIFVHGLASTEFWPPMLLGSWYFRKMGYAFCRINLYDWRPGARSLMKSDFSLHSKDLETVAEYIKKKFKKIFAVGHSFGGLTIINAQTDIFNAISLWDISSFISYNPGTWFKTDKATGAVYFPGPAELLMSKRYVTGILNFPDELSLISKIRVPTQICYAEGEQAMLVESSKRYYQNLNSKKNLVAIPNASHSFTEELSSKLLFSKTANWFKKFCE